MKKTIHPYRQMSLLQCTRIEKREYDTGM
jgi:hypothetical protein